MSKFLFFDLDGTLLGDSRTLHPDTRDALCRLHAKGDRLFVCSGRSPAFLTDLLPEVPFDGFIGCAGGCAIVEGRPLYENAIDPPLLRSVLAAFRENGIFYSLETLTGTWQSAEIREFHASHRPPHLARTPQALAAQRREQQSPSWKRLEEFDFAHTAVPKIAFLALQPERLQALLPLLEPHFHVVYFGHHAGVASGELIDRRCTKADGIRRVVEHFGGRMEDTVAFGDSMNDCQMLEAVQIAVAAEAGPAELKALTPYRFADPDQGGIARALAQLGLDGGN